MSQSSTRNRRPLTSWARTAVRSALRRLRQPAYVGENRCIPCTLFNSIVAAGVSLLTAVVYPPVGVTTFVVALGIIYLRGYLVPYTPKLTSQLAPEGILARFEHRTGGGRRTRPEKTASVEPESVLRDSGAVEPCASGQEFCLRTDFKRDLYIAITRLRAEQDDRLDLLSEMGIDQKAVDIVTYGDAFAAFDGERQLGQWTSRAAFLADVAGATVLSQRYEGWADMSLLDRGAVLSALRLFLTECPDCGGRVTFGWARVESCCRDVDVVAVACEACNSRLFEQSLARLIS